MTGYLPISRKLFEHFFWKEEREFSRAEAWIDLLRSVRFEANSAKILIGNQTVIIARGELPVSLRFLAKRWQWSKNKVDTYLNLLINERMIEKRTAQGTGQTVIKICNYDTYNTTILNEGQEKDSTGTAEGQDRDKSNKENKENNENSNSPHLSTRSGTNENFTPPPPGEVAAYCKANNYTIDPLRFINYYTSNGWMVGKNRMKDWKAAVRIWQNKEKTNHDTTNNRKAPANNQSDFD